MEYYTCIACGETYHSSQILFDKRGNPMCLSCTHTIEQPEPIKQMVFDESLKPKMKYEKKYGSFEDVYMELLATNTLIMDGHVFEYFCADLLQIEGFKNIEVTKASCDNGVDIVATKNNKKYIFQCKCISHTCSNKAVQEIISANTIYHADKMCVICNTSFSDSAKMLANQNGVEMMSIGNIKYIMDKYYCDFYEI